MTTEKESKVQSRSMNIIRKYGGYTYKNAQNMYTETGRPDITACIPVKIKDLPDIFNEDATIGLFVGIEFKRDGKLNNVSNAQQIVGRQINKAGGLWMAVDNSDIVEALMVKLTRKMLLDGEQKDGL